MPRHAIADKDRSKTKTFTLYDPEWKALIRLVKTKRLHSPFDVVRLVLWESIEPAIVKERLDGNFRQPRFASALTLKHRRGRLSRAA